jgi:uncharacterized linocin/CFP29 family protein
MKFLKRELAPLVDEAWSEIEGEAVRVLKSNLSARHVVDLEGPKGFDFSAVNLGRLSKTEEHQGVHYGIRLVMPLVELRVPFQMDIWELDNLARGAKDVDTDPVIRAALQLAAFEDHAIYQGFEPAGVAGILKSAEHEALTLPAEAAGYPDVVAQAVIDLNDDGIGGPYALILGTKPFRLLSGDVSVYPPRQRIAKMTEGPVLHSPVLEGGVLLSLRGGDFELTVGQDVSLGYHHHDREKVSLYLTETFAFRVLGPEAIVELKLG